MSQWYDLVIFTASMEVRHQRVSSLLLYLVLFFCCLFVWFFFLNFFLLGGTCIANWYPFETQLDSFLYSGCLVQAGFSSDLFARGFKLLRRLCFLCSDIWKWLDVLVFSNKNEKQQALSHKNSFICPLPMGFWLIVSFTIKVLFACIPDLWCCCCW